MGACYHRESTNKNYNLEIANSTLDQRADVYVENLNIINTVSQGKEMNRADSGSNVNIIYVIILEWQ